MKYQIWMEGYAITGGYDLGGHFIGEMEAETFEEAVKKWHVEHPNLFFDEKTLTIWGCKLFPTQEESMAFMKNYINNTNCKLVLDDNRT